MRKIEASEGGMVEKNISNIDNILFVLIKEQITKQARFKIFTVIIYLKSKKLLKKAKDLDILIDDIEKFGINAMVEIFFQDNIKGILINLTTEDSSKKGYKREFIETFTKKFGKYFYGISGLQKLEKKIGSEFEKYTRLARDTSDRGEKFDFYRRKINTFSTYISLLNAIFEKINNPSNP